MDRSAVDEESEIVSDDSRLWAVVVTFRRPEGLKSMLQALGGQTKRPDRLVIVDCGSEASVMEIARNVDAEYMDALENLGPAGGVALGMEHVLEHAASEDWLLLLDDDDPRVRLRWSSACGTSRCSVARQIRARPGLAWSERVTTRGAVHRCDWQTKISTGRFRWTPSEAGTYPSTRSLRSGMSACSTRGCSSDRKRPSSGSDSSVPGTRSMRKGTCGPASGRTGGECACHDQRCGHQQVLRLGGGTTRRGTPPRWRAGMAGGTQRRE